MASILGAHAANILNLTLVHRDGSFHTFLVDLEVHDLAHLMRILAALRAADAIAQAERVRLGDEERWEAA
jgi:(p)ppGpp synthase/HD superfamily hydrolase